MILEACERDGIAETVSRLIGMFAMAIYDRETGELHLVRDRLGIKPRFILPAWRHAALRLRAEGLRAHPAFAGTVDRDALAAYLRFAYVPAPMSIWQGVENSTPAPS
ncbi:MAG: hypothetical protein R3D02_15530 [Hyphomicrobiales bacterium]